jgi:hypothetical protein
MISIDTVAILIHRELWCGLGPKFMPHSDRHGSVILSLCHPLST